MATDEHEGYTGLSKPDVVGALKARAEAAEQRVRELEGIEPWDGRRNAIVLFHREREARAQAEAKLATAVETLRGFANRWHYAGKPIVEVEKIRQEAQRALSEIEQGDAK